MSIDELIDKARNGGGGYLNATNLYALVGDPTTDEIFVLNLNHFFSDNFRHFLKDEYTSLILLGAYNNEQNARDSIQSVRDANQLSSTGLIAYPDWYVLVADIDQNNLFTLPLMEYYIGYMTMFQYRAEASNGKVVLNIFGSEEAAEETSEIIRMYIKDEKGNIL